MKLCKILILISFLACTQVIAQSETFYLRLKFDNDSLLKSGKLDSVSYLWERKVQWAEESTAVDTIWRPVVPRMIKVGIALAGGGDRGIAHIGVLRALEENNIPIHAIAGTSMGAIIGGLYACGYSIDTLEYMVLKDIKWREIFSDQPPRNLIPIWERLRDKPREPGLDIDITWEHFWPPAEWIPSIKYKPGAGLRTAQNFTNEIAERTLMYDYYAGFNFNSLPIPYSAMLVNMATKKSELKRRGTISTATRASASLPVVFEPMKINGFPYVDGGVLDNLPVDAFIDFDSTRAPKNRMFVCETNKIPYDYVIAVHPIKRKNARNEIEEEPSLTGPFGINVVNSIMTIARDIHDWNSWDNANGRIDVDVEGNFDFTYRPLKDKIQKGYDAGITEVYAIKKQIAYIEASLNKRQHSDNIYRIDKFNVVINGTKASHGQDYDRICKAIKFKEGSYVQKIDICDAVKRLYKYGNYKYVKAEIIPYINNGVRFCTLTFFIKEQDVSVYMKMMTESLQVAFSGLTPDCKVDTAVGQKIKKYLEEENRIPNFTEIKQIIEMCMVEHGYIQPRVDSISFDDHRLVIYGKSKGKVDSIIVSCGSKTDVRDVNTKRVLESEFNRGNPVFSYKHILEKSRDLYKQFFLKTISIEDIQGSNLIVAAEKKASHTLEFPALSLENVEGLNFFSEGRSRDWFGWSNYISYAHNFPLKMAYEIPRGQKIEVGFQRCHKGLGLCNTIIPQPDICAYWQKIEYSYISDSLNYDRQYQEIVFKAALPVYMRDLAIIPGIESVNFDSTMQEVQGEWEWWERWHYDAQIRWDNLDRLIFPEHGTKFDLDAKAKLWDADWWRLRLKAKGVISWTIQNMVVTVTPTIYASYFSPETPQHEQYTLGGYTPPGSYQLRLFDYEDLIGYRRDMFQAPYMWKAGGTLRFTLLRMSPLDMIFNVHLIGYFYLAKTYAALPEWDEIGILTDNIDSPAIGLYFDSNFLNFGIMYQGKKEGFGDKFHYSLVFYGIGF